MSMHKIPLTAAEEEGLKRHGLARGTPSQLSDVFRQGMAFAKENRDRIQQKMIARLNAADERISQLEAQSVLMADVAKATQLLKNERDDEAYALLVKVLSSQQSVPVVGEPTDAAYKWMIANGVEPMTSLHKLGERLAALLDEDQFSECEALLLTAITAINTFVPVPAAELATLREKAAMVDELRGKLDRAECGMAAAVAEGDRLMRSWQEQIRKTCAALKQRNDAEKERDELRKALQKIAAEDVPPDIVDTMSSLEREMVDIASAAIAQGKGE